MLMRAHRGKQLDWSKPFVLVQSKSVYEAIQTDSNELVINVNAKPETPPPVIDKKEQIIVPKIEIVKRITEPKKFAKIQDNYIRLKDHLNLPKLENYQLNQVDHNFVQGHANKYRLNGKPVLTPEFLSKAFIQLEKKAGKDPSLPKHKNWLVNFVERQYKQLTQLPNYQSFTEAVYNYWKNRREQLKFPMLRELWRASPDQITYLLAFKTRDKQKKMTRRSVNRLNQDDKTVQQLQSQLFLVTKIAQRIQTRQKTKLKLLQLQLSNFHNECKQYFQPPMPFYTQFDMESRQKDKQNFKRLQNDFENIKKSRNQEEERQNQPQVNYSTIPNSMVFDQKQSLVEFLATVVGYAQEFNLNYQKLFNDRAIIQKQSRDLKIASIEKLPSETEPKVEKYDYMAMQVYKDGNTIYRTISSQQRTSQQIYEPRPKNIFEFRSMEMKSYYFGSDDQGQSKDLKKNISLNFKKFQQNKK